MIRSSGAFGATAQQRREGVWPRVYRMKRTQRLLYGTLGAAVGLGGLAGAVAFAVFRSSAPPALALVPLGFAALGAYLVAAVRAERLLLFEDALEITELGKGTRRVRRDALVGLRWVPLQYGQVQLVLERRGGQKPLKIGWVVETDPVLDAWLAAIPDLDAQERARAEAELLRAPELGPDEATRARTLDRARKLARGLNAVAVAACGWAWFYPRPYPAAVAALGVLPLVGLALLLTGRGRYAFDSSRTDPRPSLVVAIAGPGLVLALRALLDVHVLDWSPPVVAGAVGGLVLVAAIAGGERKVRKPWVLVLLWPLLSGHPWGAVVLANALLDRGAAEVFRTTVRAKHVSGGKHTSYELTLEPWGPMTEARSVEVGRRFYESTPVGDPVCVALRPGALGVRWYDVGRCR